MNNALTDCRFCNMLINSTPENICDTILYETENFFVVPALGSLISGYVIVISRSHVYSMAYLSKREINELLALTNTIKNIISREINISPILFEHGSAEGCFNEAANSVDHAHLHIAPIEIAQENELIQEISGFELHDFQSISAYVGKPYFLYVTAENRCYISNTKQLPSQYMRKIIANEVGCPLEWDWRKYEFIENIRSTVDLFISANFRSL